MRWLVALLLLAACASAPATDDGPTVSHCAKTADDGSRYYVPC